MSFQSSQVWDDFDQILNGALILACNFKPKKWCCRNKLGPTVIESICFEKFIF